MNDTNKPTTFKICLACGSCVLIWLYSAIFAGLPFFGIGKYVPEGYLTSCSFDYLSDDSTTRIFIAVFFVGAWVLPLAVILFCYLAIARYVIQARKKFRSTRPDDTAEPAPISELDEHPESPDQKTAGIITTVFKLNNLH